jgi:hypothetical protein
VRLLEFLRTAWLSLSLIKMQSPALKPRRPGHLDPATQAIKRLELLEIPECDCLNSWYRYMSEYLDGVPFLGHLPWPPCIHVRQTVHTLSLDDWAQRLVEVCPWLYAEKPQDLPHLGLTRDEKIELLVQRQEKGLALFHPMEYVNIDETIFYSDRTTCRDQVYGATTWEASKACAKRTRCLRR